MAWYRAGSVTVTNGFAVVTGADTSFVANVQAGHAINLPDGRAYEVLSVDSNTQLTLGSTYLGGSAGGQAYSIQPNQGFAQAAAVRLSEFLTQIGGWVAGALAGRFGDGSTVSPGISFSADQDTGLRRIGENAVAVVGGGIDRLTILANGNAGFSQTSPYTALHATRTNQAGMQLESTSAGASDTRIEFKTPDRWWNVGQNIGGVGTGLFSIYDTTAGAHRIVIDTGGNLLVGATGAANHVVARGLTEGDLVLQVQGKGHPGVAFFSAASGAASGAATAFALNRNSQTARSINAAGTINASGADYAEYMTKAADCGVIAKGDVCGVDADGKLTKSWAAAKSFVVKSTDPAYVGGDSWAAHLPPRPVEPGAAPVAPVPPVPADDATAEDRRAATAAYRSARAAYDDAKVAHDAAVSRYQTELPAWEARLEAARQCVDRIAFAGQVPVNIAGKCGVGDYLLAAPATNDGIKAVAVAAADITFDQYRRRLGKVWAIRDNRPWIDVQHG